MFHYISSLKLFQYNKFLKKQKKKNLISNGERYILEYNTNIIKQISKSRDCFKFYYKRGPEQKFIL